MRFKALRRIISMVMQPGTGGLIQSGDWRCRYPDNEVTFWMSHGDAWNYKDMFGGTLEWRKDND